MAASSSVGMIQFPDFTPSTIDSPTPEELQAFHSKATTCFHEIRKQSYEGKNSEPLQKKYNDLKALRRRVRSVPRKNPKIDKEPFTLLAKKISHEMHKLQRRFETNSHWLAMTEHMTHFKVVKPTISPSSKPKLKLNPNDIETSLANIDDLERPLEKLRGLQKLTKLIQTEIKKLEGEKKKEGLTLDEDDLLDEKIDTEFKKLKTVETFAEKCIAFQDLFLAIKQIYWVDKDHGQDKELTDLVDKTGRNNALALLKPTIPTDQMVSILASLLNDRHQKNPTRPELSFLRAWPALSDVCNAYPEYLDPQIKCERVFMLMNGLANLKSEDPKRRLVTEYLLNLLDPTGMIRIQWYQSKKLPFIKMCVEAAKIKESLLRFGLDCTHFETHVQFQKAPVDKKPPLKSQEMLARMKSGKISSDELGMIAKVLKHYTVMSFSQVGHLGFQAAFNAAGLTVGKDFAQEKLTAYLTQALKGAQDEKEQVNLMKAVLRLVVELAKCGEFTISFTLIHCFLDNYDVKKEFPIAAASIKDSKELVFLESLFDASSNNKNLKAFSADRAKKDVLCMPYVHIVGKTFIMLGEGEGKLLEALKDLLKSNFKDTIKVLYQQIGKKHQTDEPSDEKTLENLGKQKLMENWEILIECLQKHDPEKFNSIQDELLHIIRETEGQRQLCENFAAQTRVSIGALRFAHSTDQWKDMLTKTDLIDAILGS